MKLHIITNNRLRPSFRQRIGIHLDLLRDSDIECDVTELPRGLLARQAIFRKSTEYDAVLLHKKRINPVEVLLLKQYAQKVIYDFDDAVMFNSKEPDRGSRKRQSSFQRTIKIANLVIAGNSYLADHARRYNQRVEILPTGLDVEGYPKRPRKSLADEAPRNDKLRIVWIGSASTLPYLYETGDALEELGRLHKNLILRIICDKFFDLENIEVEKCQWSLDNYLELLAASDIGLAPLPDNVFTKGKCGFKILQYAAAGVPVVGSPVGVNSDLIQNGITGFHASEKSSWVDGLQVLIQDAEKRKIMGQANRSFVTQFDQQLIGRKLCDLIKSV